MEPVDAAGVTTWMASSGDAWRGFDPRGWEAATWILHAIHDTDPDLPGAHRIRWREIAQEHGLPGAEALTDGTNGNLWDLVQGIYGPRDGDLDPGSATAIFQTLTSVYSDTMPCYFHWCVFFTAKWDHGDGLAYVGTLADFPLLREYDPHELFAMFPTNIWSHDGSWMIATTEDSWRTRVSGPLHLIEALEAKPELECLRCPDTAHIAR